jgi:ABC-type transport system substrate-binding protein
MKTSLFRIAFPMSDSISKYDPAKIHYSEQYILLENLYSSLITYSSQGEIVSSVAERFEWIENELHFGIRKDLKTIDGHVINAKDVEISLKRLFILQSNMHGNLKPMLCGEKEVKNLDDRCENLEVEDDFNIVMRFERKNPFLLPMLTSADFSIIPRKSIDPETLKIVDYRNTSGPYYVEKDSENGGLVLFANSKHFYYSKNMPQEVKLVPSRINKKSHSLELFERGEVDLVSTAEGSKTSRMIEYMEMHNDADLFKTIPIRLNVMSFTPTGEANLTENERFIVAALAKKAVLPDLLRKKGMEKTLQIFPSFGQGALTAEQVKKIQKKFEAVKERTFKKKFTAWNFPKESLSKLRKCFPKAEFKHVLAVPGLVDYKAQGLTEPEIFFYGTDISIKEDVSLFSYYMNCYFFNIYGDKGDKWIKEYIKLEKLEERMVMFNKLHYDTLSEAITIPLTLSSYGAIVRKPWRFDFFNIHAGTTLWRLRYN